MGWLMLAIAVALAAAGMHGAVTGTVMTKYLGVDVKRAESPFYFWFIVVGYFVLAAAAGWTAYNDLRFA